MPEYWNDVCFCIQLSVRAAKLWPPVAMYSPPVFNTLLQVLVWGPCIHVPSSCPQFLAPVASLCSL
jgi:hypothetical protein